jgi:hypothetical protein
MFGAFELAQEQRRPELIAAMPKNSSVIVFISLLSLFL